MFEMLLTLFEQSLAKLRKNQENSDGLLASDDENEFFENQHLSIKTQQHSSIRVFTYDEQIKLTRASQQFLMKMLRSHIIDEEQFETVMSQLVFSESRIVYLQEVKWTVKNTLAPNLTEHQIAFLDLILEPYHQDYTIQ